MNQESRNVTGGIVVGDFRRFLALTWTLALTDWKLRFYGSVLGYVWQLARPFAFFGVLTFLWYGGLDVLNHLVLRLALRGRGGLPFRYTRFFTAATDCVMLRRVGGGHIFVHRQLLEHFAGLDPPAPGAGPG